MICTSLFRNIRSLSSYYFFSKRTRDLSPHNASYQDGLYGRRFLLIDGHAPCVLYVVALAGYTSEAVDSALSTREAKSFVSLFVSICVSHYS